MPFPRRTMFRLPRLHREPLKRRHLARRTTRIAQRLDRVGEIEEVACVYAETKIEELAERKLRFDHPEFTQQWGDKNPNAENARRRFRR
jgi:hypothetical protein